MDEFLAIATSFPTAVYAALLLMSMLYWLIGMIGLVDGDAGLDGAGAKIDGAADGALEAASAKIDGAADGALEAASAKIDGAAEAVEGAGGVLASIASILGLLRLRNAPLTITLTALWLFAFAASFLGAR
ncbi:MAG: hypothetical protein R3B99_30260, partial [Polyangiales bacterium]